MTEDSMRIPLIAAFVVVLLVGFVSGFPAATLVNNYAYKISIDRISCVFCHNPERQMIEYFRKAGNPQPAKMAQAVLHPAVKHSRKLAAIAVAGERNTPHTIRRGGYKNRHAGAYQVNPKYWGVVSEDILSQTLQADEILDELLGKYPERVALNKYGGDSKGLYAQRVLQELTRVP